MSKQLNSFDIDQALTKIARTSEEVGLKSFVMLIPTPHETDPKQFRISIRFNEINPQIAIQLAAHAFNQAIAMELNKHPEYSPKYRALFTALQTDFEALMKKHSAKIKKFK